jgi:hypothetical protein
MARRTVASGPAPDSRRCARSAAIGPYVDFFWRYGFAIIAILLFVSVYRMGDVLALNLSIPMILALGYTKSRSAWPTASSRSLEHHRRRARRLAGDQVALG